MHNFTITDNTITFAGVDYACNWIDDPLGDYKDVALLVSTSSLLEKLFDSDGNPINTDAQLLDDHIFYYVDDSLLALDEEELQKTIKSEIL